MEEASMSFLALIAMTACAFHSGPADTYLLRLQFSPLGEGGSRVKVHTEITGEYPSEYQKVTDEAFDVQGNVVRLTPGGNEVSFSERLYHGKVENEKEAAKRFRYSETTPRGITVREGRTLATMAAPIIDSYMLPLPKDPVRVGSSWKGHLNWKHLGQVDETCTLTRVEERDGTVYGWLDYSGAGNLPPAKGPNLEPTATECKGQAVFDITHGTFVSEVFDVTTELTETKVLKDGMTLHPMVTDHMTMTVRGAD
jgi:hypothetical protein